MEEKTGEFIYEIAKNSEGRYSHIKQGELIRCKNCNRWHPTFCEKWSIYGTVSTDEDDYCSYAERVQERRETE